MIRFGLALAVILAALVGGWWALGLRLTPNPQMALTEARAAWEAASRRGSGDYRAIVTVALPYRADGAFVYTVIDGEVTDAARIGTAALRLDPNPPQFEIDPGQAAFFTVEALFGEAARVTDEMGRWHFSARNTTQIDYDDVYGYPQDIILNTCGFFLNFTPECVTRYTVVEFSFLE